ncbi:MULTISPECIES: AEC family transporter [unclassified Cyanobium]|uniref:AEC family transporter n=1 Tax=unclassified Cyanobium TaxID=2627006 RepID=UPI0020CD4368|nr:MULTISPECIES: AEC family transporter [unclassified Cyanobium]MCP9835241.1 AEC family transporter [Cyanobium sp. La Preciosa 7G6]MCP9938007.1 AEC family transporter [Cyanobium sp. Aljojuca 7A6]
MLRFLLELVPTLGIGLLLGVRFPGLPGRLAPPLINWGIPIGLVALLLRAGFQANLLTAALMAAAASGLGLLLLRLPALGRWIPDGSLQLGCIVGNTAYWGLPVALALLPPDAIGFTIAFDLMATLITWSLGPLLVDQRAGSVRQQLRILATSPAIRGLVLAVLVYQTPWSAMVAQWLWWPARLVILVALAMVGMRLGLMLRRRQPSPVRSPGLGVALVGKLLVLPFAMLLLASLLGLPPLLRDAVVLQAAAPTAVSVLLLTEAASAGRPEAAEAVAGLVLWSTALALVSVPLWWWLLSGPLGS